jgi:hypothetical protein
MNALYFRIDLMERQILTRDIRDLNQNIRT